MPTTNKLVIKHGFVSAGDSQITGSLNASGSVSFVGDTTITGSLFVSGLINGGTF